jgi:hypothetical protein
MVVFRQQKNPSIRAAVGLPPWPHLTANSQTTWTRSPDFLPLFHIERTLVATPRCLPGGERHLLSDHSGGAKVYRVATVWCRTVIPTVVLSIPSGSLLRNRQ